MSEKKNWKEKWSKSDAIKYLYRESKKRKKGLGVLWMMFDAANSLRKYGATFHDYINLRFYIRSKEERERFLTTTMVTAEKKKWNQEALNRVDNKMEFNTLFNDFIGREWLDLDSCSFDTFNTFVQKNEAFFLKSKRESSGIGVKKIHRNEIEDAKDFYEQVFNEGYICESVLEICDTMKQLNPYSVSQIRVVTVNNGKDINILATTLRTGAKDNVEFNTAADDLFSQIDIQSGVCFTDGIDESANIYPNHPVSGIQLKGFQIPRWDEVIEISKTAAKRIPEVKVIGWDVAITPNGCAFFEGNPGSGVASMQIADGIGKKDLFYRYLNGNNNS